MQDQNKLYGASTLEQCPDDVNVDVTFKLGFTISLYEYQATIPTLWDTVAGS